MSRRTQVVGLSVAFLLLSFAIPAGASAYVYWANSAFDGGLKSIGRAGLDGSNVDQGFIKGTAGACGVAVDDSHIYWLNSSTGTIGRAKLDATKVDQDFITLPPGSNGCGVAVNETHIYWGSGASGTTVGRARIDGTRIDPDFVEGAHPDGVCGVAVDGKYVYWAGGGVPGRIGRAPLSTGVAQPNFLSVPDFPCGVAVDSTGLFWGEAGGGVGRANLNGGFQQNDFISGTGANVCGVAVDDANLYWSNSTASGPPPKTIGRSNLDGTSPDNAFIGGTSGSCGVAADSLRDDGPDARLSPPGGKKRQKAKKRVGLVITCGVDACLAEVNGVLDVVPAGGPKSRARAGKKSYKLKAVSLEVSAEDHSTAKLKIPGKPLKKAKSTLKHGGKAQVRFKVKASDAAGNSNIAKKKLKLKL